MTGENHLEHKQLTKKKDTEEHIAACLAFPVLSAFVYIRAAFHQLVEAHFTNYGRHVGHSVQVTILKRDHKDSVQLCFTQESHDGITHRSISEAFPVLAD